MVSEVLIEKIGGDVKLDKVEALMYLTLVEDTAKSEKELLAKYPDAKFIEDKETDTQCYCLLSDDFEDAALIIAFRGTEQKLRDWATDLDAYKMTYPYGNTDSKIQVHGGILKAYKSVRGKIHEHVKSHSSKIKQFFVLGHSLGAGLATLCAVDMQYNFEESNGPIICYTYGGLKVGNQAFVDSYSKRIKENYRIYLKSDWVPFLPPDFVEGLLGAKYVHTLPGFPIGPWDIFLGIWEAIKRKFSKRIMADISNHSIELYRKYLRKLKD